MISLGSYAECRARIGHLTKVTTGLSNCPTQLKGIYSENEASQPLSWKFVLMVLKEF